MSTGATPRHKVDVRAMLARVLLTREVGQRIPTVQELQQTARSGTGTVIKALRSLENDGSVSLSSHGHQGTVVVARDIGRLWNDADLGNFTLIMPPPGPIEQQGILEAIQTALGKEGVTVVVTALAGARQRLEELYHERAHAVITSYGAFMNARDALPGLASLDLGEGTFYSEGSLVVVQRPGSHGGRLRVGIDRKSYDHQLITETEFAASEPEYVDWRFVSAPAAVLMDRVDAAVWHSMPTVIPPELAGLEVRPITSSSAGAIRDASRAVVATRSLDPAVGALLRFVTPAAVQKAQRRLLDLAAQSSLDAEFWPR